MGRRRTRRCRRRWPPTSSRGRLPCWPFPRPVRSGAPRRRAVEPGVAELEDAPVTCHQPVATAGCRADHSHDRCVQVDLTRGAIEAGVTEVENAPVAGHQPVAPTGPGGGDPDDRLVEMRVNRAVEPGAPEGGDLSVRCDDPEAGGDGIGRDTNQTTRADGTRGTRFDRGLAEGPDGVDTRSDRGVVYPGRGGRPGAGRTPGGRPTRPKKKTMKTRGDTAPPMVRSMPSRRPLTTFEGSDHPAPRRDQVHAPKRKVFFRFRRPWAMIYGGTSST